MKKILAVLIALSLLGCGNNTEVKPVPIPTLLERSTVKIAYEDRYRNTYFGSGFIIHKDGYIATNFHVISKAIMHRLPIFVSFNGNKKRYRARVIDVNKRIDFAILKIEKDDNKDYPILDIGDSDKINLLDTVFVAGFPITGSFKLNKGELNARQEVESLKYLDISVLIDQGNSGGPVIDEKGRVIGICVMYFRDARSISLAIPINIVKPIISKNLSPKFSGQLNAMNP